MVCLLRNSCFVVRKSLRVKVVRGSTVTDHETSAGTYGVHANEIFQLQHAKGIYHTNNYSFNIYRNLLYKVMVQSESLCYF